MNHVYYVVVLIVRPSASGHQLLMARRAPGRYMGGTWQLISGGLEPNETAWQAALREMREETGLSPRDFYRLSTLTQFYRPDNDSLNTAPMFCAIVDSGATCTINDEHIEHAWVDLADATTRLMWPGDRAALAEVVSTLLADSAAKPYMRIALDAVA
jgi:dihydroneopterin triphosphate diphosphatase